MFKERFFLFELGTTPSGSERPTVSEDQVEEQMAKITEALMYRFAISLLIPKFFNKKKTTPNHIVGAVLDLKPIVKKKLEKVINLKNFKMTRW